jgi:multidrug resistance efflux pump
MSVQVQGPQQRPVVDATPRIDGNGHAGATVAEPRLSSAPSAPPTEASAAPAARRRPGFLNRRVLLPVAAVVVLVVALFAFNAWRDGVRYVSTDNAQLSGQPVQVGSMNAGKVDAIMPSIGDTVHKGDVVAQVALPSQVGMSQNGQPKLGFLGAGDTHVDVTAPVDGVVIAEPVAIGATVAAGTPIVSIVDPSQLWVNANIEETNISRVKVGQPVTVHVDALGQDIPGKVEAVTPATAGVFSILPASNTSGNFTKVTQLVPVRIAVNLGNQPLLLGANVEVKIRVAD